MTFSERFGYVPVKTALQINGMDTPLRNSIWNILSGFIWSNWQSYAWSKPGSRHYEHSFALFRIAVWGSFLKRPIDSAPEEWQFFLIDLREWYFGVPWHLVYDFVEFLLKNVIQAKPQAKQIVEVLNKVLENERSAYRVVDWQLARITDQQELTAIEEAIAKGGPFDAASKHLVRSLSLLADRKTPDFGNSIKEAISAVEAAANILLGRTGTLADALKELQRREIGLHKALIDGFIKIYGYTSDADGIRHALLEESNLNFDDAKFMLVACSAFVNYLQSFYIRSQK